MQYAEHAPRAALARVVRCIWIGEDASPDPSPQPVVGDGCPELLVHFGSPMFERDEEGREHLQPRAFVAGQLTRPLWLRPSGPVGVIGVRLHPWAAYSVLHTPLHELTDRRVELETVLPRSSVWVDRIIAARDVDARVSAAEAIAMHGWKPDESGYDDLVAKCVARLDAARAGPGGDDADAFSIDAIAHEVNMSRRQLERRFAERVGVSPRALGGILRLRRFFDLLDHAGAPLVDAALAAGYYDQSHFAREFRRYAGLTATEFLSTRPALASAIFDVANVQAPPRPAV